MEHPSNESGESLMYHLANFARRTPDRTAALFLPGGARLTFCELDNQANRAANALLKFGLQRGDCVVFCVENSPDLLALTFGAQRIGLYYVLASTRLSGADFDYIVADSRAKLAIVSALSEAARTLAPSVGRNALVFTVGWPDAAFDRWEPVFEAACTDLPASPSPGREMLYTSGTTGRPKGVRKPPFDGAYDAVDSRNAATARGSELTSESVYLSTAPLYHSAPNRYLSAAVHYGATSIILERFDAELALRAIHEHVCTHGLWVPTMFHRLLRLEPQVRQRYSTASLRMALHGAAPCPVHVKERMIEWWGPILSEYYSGTEGIGGTFISSTEWLEHKGSVGRATDGVLHILDESDNEVPVGKIGRVFFESHATFEYWNAPEKTRSLFSMQGWRTFGDVGYVDQEGYLYLTDRSDFTIISGGVNIYPQEIENVLLEDPRIADAAVFGIPNEEYGEEIKAVVQLLNAPESPSSLTEELKQLCRNRLGPLKVPRSIDIEAELPRHATGKLYKKQLRDRFLGLRPESETPAGQRSASEGSNADG
jgi:long-chain acyl-CoA synthetase